jgi:hypothetical protein
MGVLWGGGLSIEGWRIRGLEGQRAGGFEGWIGGWGVNRGPEGWRAGGLDRGVGRNTKDRRARRSHAPTLVRPAAN